MKRIIALLLTGIMLCSLLPAAYAEDSFVFTEENFPVLDGSTSMVPLGQAIASVLLGKTREEAGESISFHRTTQSFRNLCDGSCDVVIAAEPQSTVFDEMTVGGFSWEMETIAVEALVFVVNEKNPVDSLTAEQIRDIYAGRITNWQQVGGEDAQIQAFQRNPSSGSQVMMEKLVMDGTPMAEAPETMVPSAMGELINAVKSYDNSASAIGYTVYYYANDMQMADGLKILRVNDVEASADSLRSGSYPFLNGYYCCIAGDTSEDSPARILYRWLVSEDGQKLLRKEGYVSVYAAGEAPETVAVTLRDSRYLPGSGVSPLYTLGEEPRDTLTASDSYGLIFPYQGSLLYAIDDWEGGDGDYLAGGSFGFFTHAGRLVTDAVYSAIRLCSLGSDPEAYCWAVSMDSKHWGFAAKDGSIVSELCYEEVYPVGGMLYCLRSSDSKTFEMYDADLNLAATEQDFCLNGVVQMPMNGVDGTFACMDTDVYQYSVMRSGQPLLQDLDYACINEDGTIQAQAADGTVQLYTAEGELMPFDDVTDVYTIYPLIGRFYMIRLMNDSSLICAADGSVFAWDFDNAYVEYGRLKVIRGEEAEMYDAAGRLLRSGMPAGWNYTGLGEIYEEYTQDALSLHDLASGNTRTILNGTFSSKEGDCLSASFCAEDDTWCSMLLDADLQILYSGPCWFSELKDPCGTDSYVLQISRSDSITFLTSDCRTQLLHTAGTADLMGGYVNAVSQTGFICYAMDGTVVFCYPYYGLLGGD